MKQEKNALKSILTKWKIVAEQMTKDKFAQKIESQIALGLDELTDDI